MKITKSQLKQIIKEELVRLLHETMDFESMDDRDLEAQAHQDGIEDFLRYDYEGDIVNREEIIQALKDIGDRLSEKKLTDAEYKKKKEIADAMKRDDPDMPDDKRYAIATDAAKKSAE